MNCEHRYLVEARGAGGIIDTKSDVRCASVDGTCYEPMTVTTTAEHDRLQAEHDAGETLMTQLGHFMDYEDNVERMSGDLIDAIHDYEEARGE